MNDELAEIIWRRACPSENVIKDEGVGVDFDGVRIGLYRLEDGTVHAINDICTHEFAILSEGFVEGECIECPLHSALFNIRTGKCLGPIAEEDVQVYPVKEEGGEVFIGFPKDSV